MPGGCAIGGRPIDLHIKGLEKMGAVITQEHGYLEARAERLRGAHLIFEKITVTGTEDLLMAAVLAEGDTLMENCAREPEVVDLAALLNAMGAQIEGAGTATIRVHGVARLHGARYRINPDRIEAGTFLIAGAITAGDLIVANCNPAHLGAVIAKLQEAGARLDVLGPDSIRVRATADLRAADISTEEYPGFPTDMQAQYMALATQAEGISLVSENIFENRFMHVQELVRMGANIKVDGSTATVRGPARLSCRRRHVLRSARLCFAGAGRSGRRGRNHRGPRLSHGSRLRAHRREADAASVRRSSGLATSFSQENRLQSPINHPARARILIQQKAFPVELFFNSATIPRPLGCYH